MKKLYGVLAVFFILIYIFKTGMPLKTPADIHELSKAALSSNSYILSTSKEDTAWIMGYTNAKVIAWDFGAHSALLSENQWNAFYAAQTLQEYEVILNKLPTPLTLYVSDKEKARFAQLLTSPQLKLISPQIYRYQP